VEEVFCRFLLGVAGTEGVFWELRSREVGEEGHASARDGEGKTGVEEKAGRRCSWWKCIWTWEEINTPSSPTASPPPSPSSSPDHRRTSAPSPQRTRCNSKKGRQTLLPTYTSRTRVAPAASKQRGGRSKGDLYTARQ
jgi:hypothetical protein